MCVNVVSFKKQIYISTYIKVKKNKMFILII